MTVQVDPERTESKLLHRYADLGSRPLKRVLEVGSGDGRLTWLYANAAAQVVGVDLHPDDLRIALADRPANLAEGVHFARADAEHLPFRADTFDLAIFAWSF
jgi:ubiquinone/menaquinone biosynthesis C-methylase UbiE